MWVPIVCCRLQRRQNGIHLYNSIRSKPPLEHSRPPPNSAKIHFVSVSFRFVEWHVSCVDIKTIESFGNGRYSIFPKNVLSFRSHVCPAVPCLVCTFWIARFGQTTHAYRIDTPSRKRKASVEQEKTSRTHTYTHEIEIKWIVCAPWRLAKWSAADCRGPPPIYGLNLLHESKVYGWRCLWLVRASQKRSPFVGHGTLNGRTRHTRQ